MPLHLAHPPPQRRASTRRQLLWALGGGAGLLAAAAWGLARRPHPVPSPLQSVTLNTAALGASMSITVLHTDPARARRAIQAACERIRQVDAIMSLYRPDSQICTLNRTGLLHNPHPWLVDVLEFSQGISQATAGAFDVTIQPLWALYSAARQQKTLPDENAIAAARQLVGWQKLDISRQRIRFTHPGMAITLNAIAQGFALDRALESLRDDAIEHALVDAGEIGAIGTRSDGKPWVAGIQHPRHPHAYIAQVQLDGRSLSTSGDYATTFSDDFVFHHIFDPATGHSPRELSSVTVAAPGGAQADALSTAIMVLGHEKGLALVQSMPRVDIMAVLKDNRVLTTKGFPAT